jgi:tetratricopeptide (TPR) repeat protein
MERFEEALLEHNRTRELQPLSMTISSITGLHYYFARQYEQAVKQLTAALEMNPNVVYAHYVLCLVYLQKPTLGDAVAEFHSAVAIKGNSPRYIANLGMAYVSDESGKDEIYIGRFSHASSWTSAELVGKWQVSRSSGTEPRWRKDGKDRLCAAVHNLSNAYPVDSTRPNI